jgi:tetratricopeptide (TPR) repeat protein
VSSQIEELIKAQDWAAARQAIRRKLRLAPENHWLLTRLGLTFYEEKRYKRALKYSLLALAVKPSCPLALWDYGGCLDMLNQDRAALTVYKQLIRRGLHAIAFGDCGEGLAWARGLLVDCHYRAAHCYAALGRPGLATRSLERHVALRGPGCRSIYPIAIIRRELRELKTPRMKKSIAKGRGGPRNTIFGVPRKLNY